MQEDALFLVEEFRLVGARGEEEEDGEGEEEGGEALN